MTMRTSTKTVAFRRSFLLDGFDEILPAGIYSVETDEELIEGISFPAYRRVLTIIRLNSQRDQPSLRRVLTIDPKDLEAALLRDAAPPREDISDNRMSIIRGPAEQTTRKQTVP